MSQVKTRLLIISDTHGKGPHETDSSTDDELGGAPGANHHHQHQQYQRQRDFGSRHGTPTGFRHPLPPADVLIHCGDLTYRSTPDEFEATLTMLRAAPAPLKLFIPGNHDVALDPNFRRRRLFPIHPSSSSSSSSSSNSSSGGGYGMEAGEDDDEERAETRALVTDMIHHAEVDGVMMLHEGTHAFRLGNGALLTVYASPQTPAFGDWAFQYDEDGGHDFDIPPYSSVGGGGKGGVDVAITHGPPHGVLDYSAMGDVHAGCPLLMRAVAAARPQVHCFGHIHEGWGAYRARWAGNGGSIDEERSCSVATLDDYRSRRGDAEQEAREKSRLVREASKRRGVGVDLAGGGGGGGERALVRGEETLFVNAAIMSIMYKPVQMPWIVDVNLPKAD
ncbi:hypothetical protein N3K66_000794 [Trichothecium roseum]|uniref:Uncharacterized protein n=1 Tax=Trichothecium roseum TaxID=47278 RepID=A0ACC0VEY1_9HYPO|nr:hypothetical protein N3K66_000794 [Trichothecium roseum]